MLAFLLPDFVLGRMVRTRRANMLVQLPEVLDLLTVSVEAGLGFDGALARITERSKGPLLEELSIVLHEMRIGESRIQALKNFAERLDMPETTSFARSIIQAEQLGMSLGRILRVQAPDSRKKRQMWAEEKAMKAPIKMLFPTVIFIFPAMFIVILGPAMLQLLKLFKGSVGRRPPLGGGREPRRGGPVRPRRASPATGAFRLRVRGDVAEGLGNGLQSRVQRFKSARRLPSVPARVSPQSGALRLWRAKTAGAHREVCPGRTLQDAAGIAAPRQKHEAPMGTVARATASCRRGLTSSASVALPRRRRHS